MQTIYLHLTTEKPSSDDIFFNSASNERLIHVTGKIPEGCPINLSFGSATGYKEQIPFHTEQLGLNIQKPEKAAWAKLDLGDSGLKDLVLNVSIL